MKKVLKLVAILFSTFLIVGCSKPKITKEQQDNIATRIYRNYDIQEIEFLSFTKNESTGSYRLKIKINNDENIVTSFLIEKLDFLDKSEGELVLGPIQKLGQLKRTEYYTGNVDISNINVKYLGEQ
ncbi:hypothetical protein NQ540_09295 [Granulicatella adiacens ATCC 49175]|jgi:hypothetical protein|uniref:Lipoprotein n=1 Tax=Granulicatella adiacens ATCC 49175 TaxID=638301 RepID=C8NIV1_9LACT|nr:hypothetical protein [Granulicatella adiacens]EEW36498.1 hypothetical protein HMPREF0444_1846 [Granulicatella adiacens ATCC 49175]UAK92942.1 hypothetical protein K8O88_05295 [Granulicatella adiacens]UWP38077.1 hypothetical protein NQ540_09295 [Granulicatella adiacens ATCC 49175]